MHHLANHAENEAVSSSEKEKEKEYCKFRKKFLEEINHRFFFFLNRDQLVVNFNGGKITHTHKKKSEGKGRKRNCKYWLREKKI